MVQVCRTAGTLPGALSTPYVIFYPFLSPLQKARASVITEELWAPAAGRAAARYKCSVANCWVILGLYYDHLWWNMLLSCVLWGWRVVLFYFLSMKEMSLTGRWTTYVHGFVCVCRTTWQALCVTSVSLDSSTYQRPTLRAVYVVSVWACPNSVPAPLGIEIRWVTEWCIVKESVKYFWCQSLMMCLCSCCAVSANPFRYYMVRLGLGITTNFLNQFDWGLQGPIVI